MVIKKIYEYSSASVSMHLVFLVSSEQEESVGSPDTGITDSCELFCGY